MPGRKVCEEKITVHSSAEREVWKAGGRYGERPGDGAAEAACTAGCNQTRVNRLFHRWLIRRILRFISMLQTVPVTVRRWCQRGGIVSHTPLNSDAFVSPVWNQFGTEDFCCVCVCLCLCVCVCERKETVSKSLRMGESRFAIFLAFRDRTLVGS